MRHAIRALARPALAALFTAATLAGCGGGSGGGGTASAPAPAPAPSPSPANTPPTLKVSIASPSQLRFDWSGGQNVTEYRLLESADGTAAPVQVETFLPTDQNHDRNVFLPARVNARYVLQACNAGGCSDSVPVAVTGGLQRVPKRIGAQSAIPIQYGNAVALSADGTTLAVGSRLESGVDANNGAVHVFTRVNGTWVHEALLEASNADAGDYFGQSLALSADGNTLVVGAPLEDGNATGVNGLQSDNSRDGSGAVYLFTRNAGNWTQQAYIKASNPGAGDQFGKQLALSGDGLTLAVGAPLEDSDAVGIGQNQGNENAPDSGAVYVFTPGVAGWSQQAYVKAPTNQGNAQFGWGLALDHDGSTLAVGAPLQDGTVPGGNVPGSGVAHVFKRNAGAWAVQASVQASNAGTDDRFGDRVALSADGQTLAVSAPNEDSSATGVGGDAANDAANDSGAAYVFSHSSGKWSQQAYLKASNTGAGDGFGTGLSLSKDGQLIAVGAIRENGTATGIHGTPNDDQTYPGGAAYVFARNGGRWAQQAYVKPLEDPNSPGAGLAQEDAMFGLSLDFADDGSALAVGAMLEDGPTGISEGSAYVY